MNERKNNTDWGVFFPSEEKLNVLGARYAVCVQMDIIMIDFQIEYSDRDFLRIG